MIAGGIFLGIVGAILWFAGIKVDSDIKRQWSSYWDSGNKDMTGDIMIFIGVACVIIGLILVVYGLYKHNHPKNEKDNEKSAEESPIPLCCPDCGSTIDLGDMICGNCLKAINWKDVIAEKKRKEELNKYETPIDVVASMINKQNNSETDNPKQEKSVSEEVNIHEYKNKFCTNCGATISGAGKFCASCGMKIE